MGLIKISIIVPVYNTSEYLDECLSSLVNQTLRDIEIICVNDGSTDNSLEILRKWGNKDKRVIIIDSKVNHRQGWARNQAIKIAKGQYIGLVDSDDYISTTMYEELYNYSDDSTTDIVVGNLYATHSEIDVYHNLFQTGMMNLDDIKKWVLVHGCHMWTNIIKKDLFEKYNLWYPEELTYEDVANTGPIFLVANKIRILYNLYPLYFYRINNQSTVRKMDNPKCWDRLLTAKIFMENTKRLGQYELYNEEIDYSYFRLTIINSFMFAIFSFSTYQYKRVKDIISDYKSNVGFDIMKNNKYYKEDKTLTKRLAVLMFKFPLLGYCFWIYSHLKRKIRILNHI